MNRVKYQDVVCFVWYQIEFVSKAGQASEQKPANLASRPPHNRKAYMVGTKAIPAYLNPPDWSPLIATESIVLVVGSMTKTLGALCAAQ